MLIRNITLKNYRLYKGENSITFDFDRNRNIYLISGENGFGKTTFLHSLLWCLYGRLVSEIETSAKKEIQNGGYSGLLKSNLNNSQRAELVKIDSTIIDTIKRKGYSTDKLYVKQYAEYFVSIEFTDITIPSIQCSSVTVKRGYDCILEKEFVSILIDGVENELTQEIGSDIFINDFILNKDIARFFFFDSEQIVVLAESNTVSSRRRLCSAYNEVLGVRKYEDLQKSLINARLRFRKRSNDIASLETVQKLQSQIQGIDETLSDYTTRIKDIETELQELKDEDAELQIQLIREGSGATVEELKRLYAVRETTQKKDIEYKQLLKSFLEYAPLAISGKLLLDTKRQVENDYRIKDFNDSQAHRELLLSQIANDLRLMLSKVKNASNEVVSGIQDNMIEVINKYRSGIVAGETLLDVSDHDQKEFLSVFNYVTSTYKAEFERLTDDYKKNRQIWERTSRRISIIEAKENDALIKSIRDKKNNVEKRIASLDGEMRSIYEFIGQKNQERAVADNRLQSILKSINLQDMDAKKDALAEQLSAELKTFLQVLKQEKKSSLESRIKDTLNSLMHKDDFIHHVKVNIIDDDMDVSLYSTGNEIINKETLSKGEQQLYATSLLKALVEESGINFPVFIDSPLQKFDKTHAARIISEFYPSISSQVVLLPLLQKELSKEEIRIMQPLIHSAFVINNDVNCSYFEKVNVESLI